MRIIVHNCILDTASRGSVHFCGPNTWSHTWGKLWLRCVGKVQHRFACAARGVEKESRDRRITCSGRNFSRPRSWRSNTCGINEAQYVCPLHRGTVSAKSSSQGFVTEQSRKTVLRKEKFVDWVTADHEGAESRHNHRYSVVEPHLVTLSIQSYQCTTQTSRETSGFTTVSRVVWKAKCYVHMQFVGIWKSIWRIDM